MIRVLFVNTPEPRCGVHQYGRRLFEVLKPSEKIEFFYRAPESLVELSDFTSKVIPHVFIFNWIDGIGGFLRGAPFGLGKAISIFHDGWIDQSRWDAILFSDPTMEQNGKWFPIGRPLPTWEMKEPKAHAVPWIGVNGFLGAWATIAVRKILEEFKTAHIRLHLPYATYGDPDGARAQQTFRDCVRLSTGYPGIEFSGQFTFKTEPELLDWLSQNDLNVYMRDLPPVWRGVSSVLDLALACGRPIAINRCVAFRHFFECCPSICVEHNSMRKIIENGDVPIRPLRVRWEPERVRIEVESLIGLLLGIAL